MEPPTSEENSLPPPPIPRQRLLYAPSDIPADADGSLCWWKPTWSDVAKRLSWRWLYLIPFVLVLLLVGWAFFSHWWFMSIFWYGGKLWIWLGAGLCALGGFISLTDRRLRIGAPKRSSERATPVALSP
jgi:hypothetical protein